MAVLQLSTKVNAGLNDVERRWDEFTRNADLPEGEVDPGTIFFTVAGDGRTEVTIQIDPESLAPQDEAQLNRRVDSLLESFRCFAEEPS